MIRVRTSPDALDPSEAIAFVSEDAAGGTVLFSGTVRSPNAGAEVDHLDYEVWEDRAEACLEAIAREAVASHGASRVYIAHRTGRVQVGQCSVLVAVSSAHRPEAFEACRFVIEALKARAPIWKKEVAASGESIWVNHP